MMTLVVDSSALCYAAAYATGSLMYGDVYTGVIFGFLNQLQKLSITFRTNQFVFCWDSRSNLRKHMLDGYKKRDPEDLTKTEQEYRSIVHAQVPILRRKIIPALGFANSFMQKGYEADDIIASVVLNDLVERPVIVSSDKDLYQLLHRAMMYSVSGKKTYTKKDFIAEYGIEPEAWSQVKAIAGCVSDDVTGVEGVGDKTAAKYLKGALVKGTRYRAITSEYGQFIAKRNTPIVTLPLKGTETPTIRRDSLDYDKLIDVCREYGIRKLLCDRNWNVLFPRK